MFVAFPICDKDRKGYLLVRGCLFLDYSMSEGLRMKSFNLLLLITVVLAVISFIVKQILDYLSNKLLSGVDKNILGILENYRKKKVENFYSIINSNKTFPKCRTIE